MATALALVAGLALTAWLWRGGRWWSRALAVLALVPLGAAAWLSHVNIFEKMFSPLGDARFAAAAAAGWVGTVDPVLAVDLAATRRPTRSASSPITTSSRTWSAAFPSPSPTERSVTPVWCGERRSTGGS